MNKAEREALALFREESADRLDRISGALASLEARRPVDRELLHGIFRETHSLKSAANLLNLRPVEELCHKLEDLQERIRSGADTPDRPLIDILRAGYGRIHALLEHLHLLPMIDVSRDLAEIDRMLSDRKEAARGLPSH